MSESADEGWVSPECFRAYVNAEIKVPNTLIAVGPYVGRAALEPLLDGADLKADVERFADTFSFSPHQMGRASKTVALIHRRFGIPVLPEGVDLKGAEGVRIFGLPRFEVVYMEGVMNILEAILRLHGTRGEPGSKRGLRVAEVLTDPDRLEATVAAFAAAEDAINSEESTRRSEAFKERFDFTSSGEPPRAMSPCDKDGIQAELVPLIRKAVDTALEGRMWSGALGHVDEFVSVLTSPELHDGAA